MPYFAVYGIAVFFFFLVRGSLKSHNYLVMRSILKEKGKLDERYLPWSVIEVLLRYVEHYGIMLPNLSFFLFDVPTLGSLEDLALQEELLVTLPPRVYIAANLNLNNFF